MFRYYCIILFILQNIAEWFLTRRCPEVKKVLWGGASWFSGYFMKTVSKFGDEKTIMKYVRDQGMEKDYDVLHKVDQLVLF